MTFLVASLLIVIALTAFGALSTIAVATIRDARAVGDTLGVLAAGLGLTLLIAVAALGVLLGVTA